MWKSIVRHWRGEYGLGRAFWLHGFVTWIAVDAAIVGFSLANPDDGSPAAKLISGLSLIIVPVLIWLFVGIWRSARNARRRGDVLWPFLAQCWIVALMLMEVAFAVVFLNDRPDFG